jgi:hypothetical protein
MMGLVKFRVKPEISFLMNDPEFKRRVIAGYESQVEGQNGCGFTVKYRGYRIRFDNVESGVRGCIIYMGYAEEAPQGQQLSLCARARGGNLNERGI